VLLVTALLPKPLRDRIRAENDREADAGDGEAFGAVLGVSQAGAVVATRPDGATEVDLAFRCETPADCEGVKKLLEHLRLTLSQDIAARLLGLGPLVDTLAIEAHGPALTARAHAPTEDVARALSRLAQKLGLTEPPPAGSRP
jgi:hypothetical protein